MMFIVRLKTSRCSAASVMVRFICAVTVTAILPLTVLAAPADFCSISVQYNAQTGSVEQTGHDGTFGRCEGTFSVPSLQVAVNEGSFGVFGRASRNAPETSVGSQAIVQVRFGPFTISPTSGATAPTVSANPNFIVDGSLSAVSVTPVERIPGGNPNNGRASSSAGFRLSYSSSGPAGDFLGSLGGGDVEIQSITSTAIDGTGRRQIGVINSDGIGEVFVGPTGLPAIGIDWSPSLPIELPVGQEIFFSLDFIGGLRSSIRSCDQLPPSSCQSVATLNMGRTFAFPSGESVFDLPEGFTVSGLGGQVVDNIWLGESVSLVPIPGAVWLFGTGLLGLIGIARRNKA